MVIPTLGGLFLQNISETIPETEAGLRNYWAMYGAFVDYCVDEREAQCWKWLYVEK